MGVASFVHGYLRGKALSQRPLLIEECADLEKILGDALDRYFKRNSTEPTYTPDELAAIVARSRFEADDDAAHDLGETGQAEKFEEEHRNDLQLKGQK